MYSLEYLHTNPNAREMAHLASAASRQGSDSGAAGESKADKGSAGGGTQLRVLIQDSDAATAAATIVIFKGQEIKDDEILAVAGMSDGSPHPALLRKRAM